MGRRWYHFLLRGLALSTMCGLLSAPWPTQAANPHGDRRTQLPPHLANIATVLQPAPMIAVPGGWFLMGTIRKDDAPYAMETQFDDAELPQHRIWLDQFWIDRDEVSVGEYVAFLLKEHRPVSQELQKLLWHVITVHLMPDRVLARWPALYVTWAEASDFCRSHGKRLPTEAEWEKAARGPEANLFPWGTAKPSPGLAVFGAHHVHEIPLVAAVDSGEEGQSPYGIRHLSGNVAEWVQDWFGLDYYAITPERNPKGPSAGRYKAVRGGSWKSKPNMLRTATRGGASADQRSATVGFRCARSVAP